MKNTKNSTLPTLPGKPLNLAKNGTQTALSKANPFDKPINNNDVSDTGTESLKLGYSTAKKGKKAIKTVGKSIKTTTRTVKSTGKAAKTVGTAAKKTAVTTGRVIVFAVKGTITVVKFTAVAIAAVVAAITNPIVLLCIAIVIILILLAALVVLLVSGGAAATATNNQAYNAVGLVDIPGQYQNGLEFYDIAVSDQKAGFESIIDGIYYDYNHLSTSDLSYMRRKLADGTISTYERSFTPDTRKGGMKAAWFFTLDSSDVISIAYVYLEKEANAANGTENAIYEVTFTQDVFDIIIGKCVSYSDSVFNRQACPDRNCTEKIVVTENPDYAAALEANNAAADAYNDWAEVTNLLYENSQLENTIARDKHWEYVVTPPLNNWIVTYNRYPTTDNNGEDFLDVLGTEYEEANAILESTPETIETVTYVCNFEHDLHSIGLTFSSKDTVLNALGFTEAEKQWVELTKIGFENNPDIP